MRKQAIHILFFISSILTFSSVSGQDLAFSQFYSNPVYLNPALAGNRICPRVTLNYRNQYPGMGNHYVSYCAGADTYLSAISGGVAVMASADMTGLLGSYTGSAVYSYHLNISKSITMNAALQAGYIQYKLNWDKLVFEDMIVTGTGEIIAGNEKQPDNLNVGDMDFSSGIVFGYNDDVFLAAGLRVRQAFDMPRLEIGWH